MTVIPKNTSYNHLFDYNTNHDDVHFSHFNIHSLSKQKVYQSKDEMDPELKFKLLKIV